MKSGAEIAVKHSQAEDTWSHQKWPERILPQSGWREHSSGDALMSHFWLPELRENKFLLF